MAGAVRFHKQIRVLALPNTRNEGSAGFPFMALHDLLGEVVFARAICL
jgi:hypothetical protein